MEYIWVALIPFAVLVLFLIYSYIKRPVLGYYVNEDEIKVYLNGGDIEKVGYDKFDKIKLDAVGRRHPEPGKKFIFTLYFGDKYIWFYYNDENKRIVEKIIKQSRMEKTRTLDGLIWKKIDGYLVTEYDLKFDMFKGSSMGVLFVTIVLGIGLIFLWLKYFVK